MVYLNGVAKGNVSGNTFDCGGQGRVDPLGRFVLSNHSTDVNITGNTLSNVTGNVYSDVAASSNIILENNHGATGWNVGYYESATNLGDSMHVVNTRGKIVGKKVWDTTNLFFVYASGSNPTDAWHDGTGADVITPGP
jgi:hypothetical protein